MGVVFGKIFSSTLHLTKHALLWSPSYATAWPEPTYGMYMDSTLESGREATKVVFAKTEMFTDLE